MSSYTLADIQAAADAKFGSTDIDLGDGAVVKLRNPIRLSTKEREQLQGLQKRLSSSKDDDGDKDSEDASEADIEDQERVLEDMIRLVADSRVLAERLIESLEGDLGQLMGLITLYTEGTQAGEA